MTTSLLEKARAGRLNALAAMQNRTTPTHGTMPLFDLEFVEQKPSHHIQFMSRRSVKPEEQLAA